MLWLSSIPIGITQACVNAIPKLQAEESLIERDRISVGTGSLKPQKSREIQDGWIRAVQSKDREKRPASPSELASMGIGYQRVKKT